MACIRRLSTERKMSIMQEGMRQGLLTAIASNVGTIGKLTVLRDAGEVSILSRWQGRQTKNAHTKKVGDKTMKKDLIFENDNGNSYFVIAGNDQDALLRSMRNGGYVIAWGLDRKNRCWQGGSYFSADEFEIAAKIFFKGR